MMIYRSNGVSVCVCKTKKDLKALKTTPFLGPVGHYFLPVQDSQEHEEAISHSEIVASQNDAFSSAVGNADWASLKCTRGSLQH